MAETQASRSRISALTATTQTVTGADADTGTLARIQTTAVGGECVWHEVTCNLLLPIGTGAIGHRKAALDAVCCRRREKIVNHNIGEGARILKQVAELGELLVV